MNPIIKFDNVSYSYSGDEQEKEIYAVKNDEVRGQQYRTLLIGFVRYKI